MILWGVAGIGLGLNLGKGGTNSEEVCLKVLWGPGWRRPGPDLCLKERTVSESG